MPSLICYDGVATLPPMVLVMGDPLQRQCMRQRFIFWIILLDILHSWWYKINIPESTSISRKDKLVPLQGIAAVWVYNHNLEKYFRVSGLRGRRVCWCSVSYGLLIWAKPQFWTSQWIWTDLWKSAALCKYTILTFMHTMMTVVPEVWLMDRKSFKKPKATVSRHIPGRREG